MRLDLLKEVAKEGSRVKVNTHTHSYTGVISYRDDVVVIDTAEGKVVISPSSIREITVIKA